MSSRLLSFCILFFVFSIVPLGLIGQKSSAEHMSKAERLSKEFEESDVALLENNSEVLYKIDPKTNMLTVTETTEWVYLGLKANVDYTFVQFYDETSSIEVDQIVNGKGKKVSSVFMQDEYYNQEEYFYSDARVKYMTFGLDKGQVQRIKTTKHYTDAKYFTREQFYSSVPLVKKKVTFLIPNNVEIELKEYNFEKYEISKSENIDTKKNLKRITFSAMDIEPAKKERNSEGPAHFLPHLLILPKTYVSDKTGKQVIFEKTEDLYKWYQGLVKSMDNNPTELTEQVNSLLEGEKDDLEKVKKLYYWVQDNIRYIAFEDGIAGFKPDECQHVYTKKYGDCKGMANLLKEMLIIAGFDARLTWIGTDRIPYDYSTPSLAVDNHMICTLIFNGKNYFLDPTERFNSLGHFASRIQGKQALIENGDDFILDMVPSFDESVNLESNIWELSIENEQLIGQGKNTYAGERLVEVLYSFSNIKLDNREDAIKGLINSNDKNFKVKEVKHSDASNRDELFVVDYELALDNRVSSFDSEVYIDLDYYKEFNSLKFEERKTDYLFSYKHNLENSFSLQIPTGYKVKSLPEGLDIENDYFKIFTSVKQEGSEIKYKKRIALKKRKIPTEYFKTWNEEFLKLSDFYQEQAILEKE